MDNLTSFLEDNQKRIYILWAECGILKCAAWRHIRQIAAFKMLKLVYISEIRIFQGEKWRINVFWDATLCGWAIVTSSHPKTREYTSTFLNTQRGITVDASTKFSCKTMASDFIHPTKKNEDYIQTDFEHC